MDIIYLRELKVETIIGIYDWERKTKQTLVIDLEMGTDIRKAAATDNIKDTLDYKSIAKRITSFIKESEYQLVETVAEKVTELLRDEFNISWIRLNINKRGAIRGARDVGVIIERGSRT